jgi:hypothetical protein
LSRVKDLREKFFPSPFAAMHAADFRALAVGENVEVTTATAIATDSDSRRAGGIFELGKGESHTFCTGSTGLGLPPSLALAVV